MSDLISRSELLKELTEYEEELKKDRQEAIVTEDEYMEFAIMNQNTAIYRIKRCVMNMLTAYDVDNVVKKLEELADKSNDYMYESYFDGKEDGIREGIEIVKQGGISDDVCEWRLCDEEANVYDTSCRNPHILIEGTPKENNYEYCTYCGKKIKIVGD